MLPLPAALGNRCERGRCYRCLRSLGNQCERGRCDRCLRVVCFEPHIGQFFTCTRAASFLKISSRLRDPRTLRPGSRSDRPRPELRSNSLRQASPSRATKQLMPTPRGRRPPPTQGGRTTITPGRRTPSQTAGCLRLGRSANRDCARRGRRP